MPKVYDFRERNEAQEGYVEAFRQYLSGRSDLIRVYYPTKEQDLSGIDLIADIENSDSINFQVKTDFQVHKTDFLPYEVISQAYVQKTSVIGWGFNIEHFDYIAYINAQDGEVFICDIENLAAWVIDNFGALRTFVAKNKGYFTLGVLLPFSIVRKIAFSTGSLQETIAFKNIKSKE